MSELKSIYSGGAWKVSPRYEEPDVTTIGKLFVTHRGKQVVFEAHSFDVDTNGVLLIYKAYSSILDSEKPIMGLIAAFSSDYSVVVDGECDIS